MTKTELFELIAAGENSGVEFKRDDVRPEQVAKECVALLNLKGGYVVLGVEDNGDISSLTRKDCQEWVFDTVFGRYVHPPVIPEYFEISTEDGKVGVISLSQGISKPYSVKKRERYDVYIRAGDTSRPASHEQVLRLQQESGLIYVETLPVNGTTINDLDSERFKWYYETFYGEKVDETQLGDLLKRLDFASESAERGVILTIAGNLLFAKQPLSKLPHAGFRIISYPGNEADINASFDEVIDEPIIPVREEDTIVKYGLVDQIVIKLQVLLSEEKLDENGHTRKRYWKYPKEVLRELVLNAIAHRDWTKFSRNKIEMFENRIEITSAGAIPNNQTIEKMLAGVQYSRNQRLVRVLRDIGEMDERGMGLRRRVIPILKEQGFPEPIFESAEDYFKVTLLNK